LSERKHHEEQLAEQARLLDLSNDAIIVRDVNDRITYWNKGATEIYGYTRQEALGKVTRDLLKTEFPEPLSKICEKLLRNNRWEGEIVHSRRDGRRLTIFSRWALDRDAQGNRAYVLETNNDITRRKEAEAALQKSKKLLEQRVRERTHELRVANKELEAQIARRKGLEGEILEISDREQQRLGQELHDGLCQHLTAVAFMARSVALRLKNHRVVDAGDIEKIAQLVNDAATDTRNLSRALHRIDVDAAGLVDALQDLVDREIWKIPCRLEPKPSFRIENDFAAGELYRIAREAVINANKHSEAREIVIELERAGKEMVLRVIDDGVGFPSEPKMKRGLGFHIMGYRARLIGARLEIDSPKRRGTRVSCYLPDEALQSRKRKNPRTRLFPARITKTLAALS
jgi:PAS domain S-box-containing protein